VPKSDFKEFIVNELTAVTYLIQQISQKVFIPIGVAQSIVMPETEVTLILRNA